jgi:hypothetical protein
MWKSTSCKYFCNCGVSIVLPIHHSIAGTKEAYWLWWFALTGLPCVLQANRSITEAEMTQPILRRPLDGNACRVPFPSVS